MTVTFATPFAAPGTSGMIPVSIRTRTTIATAIPEVSAKTRLRRVEVGAAGEGTGVDDDVVLSTALCQIILLATGTTKFAQRRDRIWRTAQPEMPPIL